VDACMVDPAHPGAKARAPGDPVIERARAEHSRDRGGEDGCCDAWTAAISFGDEQPADDERDHEGALMQRSAQERPFAVRHVSRGSMSHTFPCLYGSDFCRRLQRRGNDARVILVAAPAVAHAPGGTAAHPGETRSTR